MSLLVIGWLANRSSHESSIKDYYLAGSSLGFLTLFFTLYATQYSGNTLLALPGKAYRSGFAGLGVMFAVMAVPVVYSSFAPKLNALAQRHRFITVGDFLQWRYQHRLLRALVNIVLVITLVSYALGNFKAIGLLLESASGGAVSFVMAVLCLALVMAIYESLGGMRGVVWTDVLQGMMLLCGCLVIYFAVADVSERDSVTRLPGLLHGLEDFFSRQWHATNFFSLIILIGLGAAVYPQAIQRIYAARNDAVLKQSYYLMFFMPLLTSLPMILVGMNVREWLPDLGDQDSEQVLIYAINRVVDVYPMMSWMLILCLSAALAAIMSTIDSALLSLGSILTGDLLLHRVSLLDGERLHRISRMISWCLMMLMAILAIVLPQTIWALMVFKFEILIQLSPGIILGVRYSFIKARAVFVGLVAGICCAVLMKVCADVQILGVQLPDTSRWLGIHSGVWGLLVNVVLVFSLSLHRVRTVDGNGCQEPPNR